MYSIKNVEEVLATTGRMLTFQKAVPDLKRLGPLYLAMGLAFSLGAGVARHWDAPYLNVWRRSGLESAAYVLVFSIFLWVVLWPLRPENWRLSTVTIFVALTAPPAFLYILPGFLHPERLVSTS